MRPSWIRFFAHLCLFLTMAKQPVPAHASAVVLEAYIQVLEVRAAPFPLPPLSRLTELTGT